MLVIDKNETIKFIKQSIYKAVLSQKGFIIAANWKMNKNTRETNEFLKSLKEIPVADKDTVIIFPTSPYLYLMRDALRFGKVLYGAQNIFYESSGAFTGEISAGMAEDLGCKYAIIGHSERRSIFKETDDMLNKKVDACIKNGMKAILCIGEDLNERNGNQYKDKLKNQINIDLDKFPKDKLKEIVIAYEPIWAIGTGVNATPEQVEETHCYIRSVLDSSFGAEGKDIPILYGGSVKASNVGDLAVAENVSGFLIGGASLKIDEFGKIISILSGT